MNTLKQNQVSVAAPAADNLPGADALAGLRSYSKDFICRVGTILAAYMALLKMRSATLNSLSALLGVLLAAGSAISLATAAVSVIAVWLVAAGSGAINSYLDRDIDRVMHRTSLRPLPLGSIQPAVKAWYAGIFLVATGLVVSLFWLNWLATLFIALGAAIYIFVYTMWLKRKTPWSVVIGGLAGSCALLAGWFAVTTGFGLLPLLLAVLIFLWTPGHFWGLAIRAKGDSERAKIPTLATAYGQKTAARWTALANMALIPFSIIPYALGILGEVYLFTSLLIGLVILVPNVRLYFAPTVQKAWTAFKLSSPYLAVVYLAVAIDILLI